MADFDPTPRFTLAEIAILALAGFVVTLVLISGIAQLVRWLA